MNNPRFEIGFDIVKGTIAVLDRKEQLPDFSSIEEAIAEIKKRGTPGDETLWCDTQRTFPFWVNVEELSRTTELGMLSAFQRVLGA